MNWCSSIIGQESLNFSSRLSYQYYPGNNIITGPQPLKPKKYPSETKDEQPPKRPDQWGSVYMWYSPRTMMLLGESGQPPPAGNKNYVWTSPYGRTHNQTSKIRRKDTALLFRALQQIFGCWVGMPQQINTLITVSALYWCFRVFKANANAGFFLLPLSKTIPRYESNQAQISMFFC